MSLVRYTPEDSKDFFDEYYKMQAGNGIGVYSGRRVMPNMRGNGLGSIFSSLLKSAAPMLKRGAISLGKRALSVGGNVARDVIDGQSFAASAKKRGLAELNDLGGDVLNAVRPDRMKRRKTRGGKKRRGVGKRGIF